MRIVMKKVLLLVLSILIVAGCQPEKTFSPMKFAEMYPGDLSKVTKIEIRFGDGEQMSITDQAFIVNWLNTIKDITFEPEEDQEGRVGYVYALDLFEAEELKFSFNSVEINEFYYKPNRLIHNAIEELLAKAP